MSKKILLLGLLSGLLTALIAGIISLIGFFQGELAGLGDLPGFIFSNPIFYWPVVALSGISSTCFLSFTLYNLPGTFGFNLFGISHKITANDRREFSSHLAEAREMISSQNPHSCRSAVILMDNLLDKGLSLKGFEGTLGEKLKVSGSLFNNVDRVWKAHKHRNKLVHDLNYAASTSECHKAVEDFAYALKELGLLK